MSHITVTPYCHYWHYLLALLTGTLYCHYLLVSVQSVPLRVVFAGVFAGSCQFQLVSVPARVWLLAKSEISTSVQSLMPRHRTNVLIIERVVSGRFLNAYRLMLVQPVRCLVISFHQLEALCNYWSPPVNY